MRHRFLNIQNGNVLFIILIAVALFAALSYAVTQDRTSVKDKTDEQQKLDQAVIDNYMTCINQGQMTLQIARGCNTINYDPPSEWSGSNFNCHMFHPQGAGCAHQDLGLDACYVENKELTDLEIGEACGNIVYAGESGGNRVYTTFNNTGQSTWSDAFTNTGARSHTDGLSNTNLILSLSNTTYGAVSLCRALGDEWYLPSYEELQLLYNNRNEGLLNGTFPSGGYSSSTEFSHSKICRVRSTDGNFECNHGKENNYFVRCVRRD